MKIIAIYFSLLFSATVCYAQAPEIVSVTPSQNELNVPNSSDISVTFDTDMDARTINESSFITYSASRGIHRGQITYDDAARRATLDPFDDFDSGNLVTVILTTDIRTPDGHPLPKSFVWSFTSTVHGGTAEFVFDNEYIPEDPLTICAADLDIDGDNDLVCTNWTSNSISVLFNNGNGTFIPGGDYPVGAGPSSVAAAEINGIDGIDLVITNAGSHNISVLFNDGDGGFEFNDIYGVDYEPNDLYVSDFDGDGHNDVATVNFSGSTVSILFNEGDGSFVSPDIRYEIGYATYSIIGGDFDNDGDLDLAASVYSRPSLQLLINAGDGTFTMGEYYRLPDPIHVSAADLNADSYLDLTATNFQANVVSVLLNEGNGGFGQAQSYVTGSHAWDINTGDFDGDGDIDIANGGYDSNIAILPNDGEGNFGYPSHHIYSRFFHPADLDNDGDLDIATVNPYAGKIYIILNENSTYAEPGHDVLPANACLNQNYPNPFNATTEISFYLPNRGVASLTIYDITGRQVRRLVDSELESGVYSVVWDCTDDRQESLASGVYLYSLIFESNTISRRLVLLK